MDALSADLNQSRTTRKSAGNRDVRSMKANKNKSVEASAMPDLQAEKDFAERIRTRRDSEDGRRVPSKRFSSRIIRKVLELTRQGHALSEMARLSRLAHFPSLRTLNRWRAEDPEFADQLDSLYTDYADDQARQILPLVNRMTDVVELEKVRKLAATMPRVKGLKPFERVSAIDRQLQRTIQASAVQVNAIDSRAQRTLQVAGSRDSKRWGGKGDGDGGSIFYEISLTDIKTTSLPGSPDGQNVKALEAMRKEPKKLTQQPERA